MAHRAARVGDLAHHVAGKLIGEGSVEVNDLTHDSRQVGAGVMFIAVRGATADGHEFVDQAVAAGAPAICVEYDIPVAVPRIVVPNTRAVMGRLASRIHGEPSMRVDVVGVTGTNGKTTVTHFVESMHLRRRPQEKAGLIGTVVTRVGDRRFESVRTTPEATDFQRLLDEMIEAGATMVAAEVSSHALELGRVDGTTFAVAAFTNLSQDHLDFHGSMGEYRRAKERLFSDFSVGTSVINTDDPVGAEIAGWVETPHLTVGAKGDVRAQNLVATRSGSRFDLVTPGITTSVTVPVVGNFNVSNALVAAACGIALGWDHSDVVRGLEGLPGVPGRFELVSGDGPFRVVVDYAHTPDGVRSAISAARAAGEGRVIVVVGAGGDRDRSKRPLMGSAACEADLAVLTSDNPRSEDPAEILAEVASGASGSFMLEVDRRRAISVALDEAAPGDLVLILGKGHERGQEVAGQVLPFDDREVARSILTSLGSTDPQERSGSMVQ